MPMHRMPRSNNSWKMKRRRPMAILSAAIGAYLVLSPPPEPIAHSVMEDGEGGYTHIEDAKYSPAQQLSLLSSNEEDESVAETIRPSLERTSSSVDEEKDSKNGGAPALEETTSNNASEVRSKEKASKPLDKPTSNNATKVRSKETASKPLDKPNAKKATKANAKKTAAAGPLFHMVFTTGSTTLSTLNVRSIESVFHANPNGRLHIHQPKLLIAVNSTTNNSTILLDKTHPRLAPLIEHGYNITFHR